MDITRWLRWCKMDLFYSFPNKARSQHPLPRFAGFVLTLRESIYPSNHNKEIFMGKYQPDGEAYPFYIMKGYFPNKLSYVAPPRRGKVCNGKPMVASHWGTYRFWCIFSLCIPYGVYFLTPILILWGSY